jgi:translocation protein SEC72
MVSAPNGDVASEDINTLNALIKALIATNSNPQPLPPGVPPQFRMSEFIPPPPQPIPNIRSNHIAKAKEDGNTAFRSGKFQDSIKLYSISAALSATRPVFESAQYSRDELSIALCNRSAAYGAEGSWIEALVDANAVIQLKKQWTKGYFRKGKALAGLGQLQEAKEALLLGLEFEPANDVSLRVFVLGQCADAFYRCRT